MNFDHIDLLVRSVNDIGASGLIALALIVALAGVCVGLISVWKR